MMTSQILRSVYLTKSRKPKYLENKTLFSVQIKQFIDYTSKAKAEVTFKYIKTSLTLLTLLRSLLRVLNLKMNFFVSLFFPIYLPNSQEKSQLRKILFDTSNDVSILHF